jgi:hypothetical protein
MSGEPMFPPKNAANRTCREDTKKARLILTGRAADVPMKGIHVSPVARGLVNDVRVIPPTLFLNRPGPAFLHIL